MQVCGILLNACRIYVNSLSFLLLIYVSTMFPVHMIVSGFVVMGATTQGSFEAWVQDLRVP